ncbi:MAG: pyrroline-5-carboxylate reductase [Dehalococcoidales bacterium]|nr:MAG: pyrroline-5-carboxylate reductase [Dehalococcoidales bacterium]
MKIAFIGGGNMGEAMLSAVLGKHLATIQSVIASDSSPERRQYLTSKYGIAVIDDNRKTVAGADVIVLAIKPQNLAEVMAELNGLLGPEQLVLSIIAGVRLDTICQGLGHRAVVRAMPNTPAQIGQGMTVWTATEEVSEQQNEWAGSILSVMGHEIAVSSEDQIDMATAISGSGPAYLFLFVEALVNAAVQLGLSHDMAQELVLTTVLGSGHLIEESGIEPAELRRMVTSPGGTTAEALREFEQGEFSELLTRAVRAAYERAKQLGS